MSEPTTAAGRRFFATLWAADPNRRPDELSVFIATAAGDIAAIEQEARQALRDELAAAVERTDPGEVEPDWRTDRAYLWRAGWAAQRAAVLALISANDEGSDS